MINSNELFEKMKAIAKTGPLTVMVKGPRGAERQMLREVIFYVTERAGGLLVSPQENYGDTISFTIERDRNVQPKRKGRPKGCAPSLIVCTTCGYECPPATKHCPSCLKNPRDLPNPTDAP